MERRDQFADSNNAESRGANAGTASNFSSGNSPSSTSSSSAGSGASDASTGGSRAIEVARERLEQGKEAVANRVGQVKEKAGHLKTALADKLEDGADLVRERSHGGSPRLASAAGEASTAVNERISQYGEAVATSMERTAGWLRDGDLGTAVERQVQEHPARSLLIALGVGYLIGRALNKD